MAAKVVLTRFPGLVALGTLACITGVALTSVKSTFVLSWVTAGVAPLFDRSTVLTVVAISPAVQVVGQPFGAVPGSRIDLRLYQLLPTTGSIWSVVGRRSRPALRRDHPDRRRPAAAPDRRRRTEPDDRRARTGALTTPEGHP